MEPKGKGGRAGLWGTGNLHYRASGGHPMLVETIGVLECSCGHFRQNVTAFSQDMQLPCREEAETREALGGTALMAPSLLSPTCHLHPCLCVLRIGV